VIVKSTHRAVQPCAPTEKHVYVEHNKGEEEATPAS
jgi:hypothetical protein